MTSDDHDEKASTILDEVTDSEVYRPDVDVSSVDERKLLRRIDLHVVPWLTLLYLLNFLDKGNIGNARVCISIFPPLTYLHGNVASFTIWKRTCTSRINST